MSAASSLFTQLGNHFAIICRASSDDLYRLVQSCERQIFHVGRLRWESHTFCSIKGSSYSDCPERY